MGTPLASSCQSIRHTARNSTVIRLFVDALRDVLLRTLRHRVELVSRRLSAITAVVLADSKQENRFVLLALL